MKVWTFLSPLAPWEIHMGDLCWTLISCLPRKWEDIQDTKNKNPGIVITKFGPFIPLRDPWTLTCELPIKISLILESYTKNIWPRNMISKFSSSGERDPARYLNSPIKAGPTKLLNGQTHIKVDSVSNLKTKIADGQGKVKISCWWSRKSKNFLLMIKEK